MSWHCVAGLPVRGVRGLREKSVSASPGIAKQADACGAEEESGRRFGDGRWGFQIRPEHDCITPPITPEDCANLLVPGHLDTRASTYCGTKVPR